MRPIWFFCSEIREALLKESVKIEGYYNGLDLDDDDYLDETLYMDKYCTFFLHGVGGINTKYAYRDKEGYGHRGTGFYSLYKHEARTWCEKNDMHPRAVEEIFRSKRSAQKFLLGE